MSEVRPSLALASSNPGKIRLFRSKANNPNEAGSIPALFNEDRIKEIHAPLKHSAFEYAAHISRDKFSEQRANLQTQEGKSTDYAVIVSDSLVVVEKNGDYIAVNRDDPAEEQTQFLNEINKMQTLTFAGAVTFGNKNGEGMTTLLSYIDIPLAGPLSQVPSPEDIPKLKDPSRPYQVGYIQVGLDGNNNPLYLKKVTGSPWAFDDNQEDDARPYISGLTSEVLSLADGVSKFERDIEPILQHVVQTNPFNTLSFYNPSLDPDAFYDQIASSNSDYFTEHGGNCVLFSIHTGKELKKNGFRFKASYIAPSSVLSSGHTALIVQNKEETLSFFVDPGLSLVQPIVLQESIPLYPFTLGGSKQIFVDTASGGPPHLRIHTKKAKSDLQLGEPMEFADFLVNAPDILRSMHALREVAKLDYHDKTGRSICSCSVNLGEKTVCVKAGSFIVNDIPLGHLLSQPDALQAIDTHLSKRNISSTYLLSQLSNLIT